MIYCLEEFENLLKPIHICRSLYFDLCMYQKSCNILKHIENYDDTQYETISSKVYKKI